MASPDQNPVSEEGHRKRAVSLFPLSIPSKPDRFNSITAFRPVDDDDGDEGTDDYDEDINSAPILEDVSSCRRADGPSPSRVKSASLGSVSFSPMPSARGHRVTDSRRISVDRTQNKESDFLTVLATQERRVLELKEELQKAEQQLAGLKQHWAKHESARKRDEGRDIQRLRTLSTSGTRVPDQVDDFDGSSAWMYEEMERRKALIGHARNSSRRVFSGSRHTRTLSLVASNNSAEPGASGQIQSPDSDVKHSQHSSIDASSQSSSAVAERSRRQSLFGGEIPNLQHEHLMRTGRQVASGLKDGLWTLLEDIKQATVGDEARSTHPANARKSLSRENSTAGKAMRQTADAESAQKSNSVKGSSGSMKSNSASSEIESNFWSENGLLAIPSKTVSQTPQRVELHTRVVDGEAWDTWDTPQDKMSPAQSSKTNSPIQSQSSPTPSRSSPGTSRSNSMDEKEARVSQDSNRKPREAIPWPALTKLASGHLRRTASHLMEDWERSLTPDGVSPKKNNGRSDGSVDRATIDTSRT